MMAAPEICAVIAHDAGGAEILSSYVSRQGLRCLYVLQGPARKIFERKLGNIEMLPLDDAVRKADWVLCGTSWQSELEFDAIKLARALGKRSVAFLDHWVNYRQRFERQGELNLPDEIWVGDAIAAELAGKLFGETPIRLVENPYFMDIRAEVRAAPATHPGDAGRLAVLYVCEPVREHALRQHGNERHWGYTEEDALRYFLANVAVLGRPIERILIRPHPSEAADKYDWVKNEFDYLPIVFGGSHSLVEEIADSDVVVGCASMAMVVGLLAGKRVISCIPPGGPRCALPQPEIELMQQMLGQQT
jgi:hypothetical protein